MLHDTGVDEVLIDDGVLAPALRRLHPDGVEHVQELAGTTTLLDSLLCAASGATVCMAGMVGNAWELDRFSPMHTIPTAVKLTTYSGAAEDFIATPLQEVVDEMEAGRLNVPIGRVFDLDDIVAAHRLMEDNTAGGKIVVVS